MTTERDRKSAAIAAVAVLWEERDPSFSSEASFDVPRGQGSSHAEALVRDGVVLRPDFAFVTGDFAFSFTVVAWCSWLPNLLFAEWWLARTSVHGRRLQSALAG